MTHKEVQRHQDWVLGAATKEDARAAPRPLRKHWARAVEIGPAIEKAAKDAETATATKMAECIAGGIKDTVEAIHRDPDGFFKGGAR